MMATQIINQDSVQSCGSNDNYRRVSLFDILFSFLLKKYIASYVCKLRYPLFESSIVLCVTPTYVASMQELIMQGMQ